MSFFSMMFLQISVADTEHWRRELTRIAEMVGLVTTDELNEIGQKKDPSPTKTPPRSSSSLKLPSRRSSLRSANGEYSTRTGRWNETPRAISRSQSSRRRTPLSAILPNHLFCVDEKERETWVKKQSFRLLFSCKCSTLDDSSSMSNFENKQY